MVERILSLAAWLASIAAAYFLDNTLGVWLVGSTTLNLLHFRFVDWWAGRSLRDRVLDYVDPHLDFYKTSLEAMRKDVDDIKESQNKMISSFRTGRNLPG